MSKRTILLTLCTIAVLAASATPSARAAEAPGEALNLAAEPGLPTDCEPAALDLGLAGVASAPAVTPALPNEALEPVPLVPPFFTRTCRCSCGSPCKTDADCGPGGRCTAGITCC